jgi:hypothetical protein
MMKLKIAILGTRGIPNQYGGFEQWAEQLSQQLAKQGHQITVYSSHYHPYKNDKFNGVKIVRKWDPKNIGLASQFLYDLLCVIHARKQNFDVILQLGYTTSSVWARLLPKTAKIIYNMDGMEWQREKYKGFLSLFLKHAEKLAVKYSRWVIADSKPVKHYLDKKYAINSVFIPYPATIFNNPDESVLKRFNLEKNNYYLLIARFQPDNNPETVIQGLIGSKTSRPLVIIGDYNNRYGKYLQKKYHDERIRFLGRIYDKSVLDNLRHFSALYFHGHSAGGTNPSLLEAMAASAVICAHDNKFNRSVTGNDALYFKNAETVTEIIESGFKKSSKPEWISNNLNKLREDYNMDKIVGQYLTLMQKTD